ncbi:hypothetical protein DITRI_Ditri11bG0018600 [Diplodiscus trichospermus]
MAKFSVFSITTFFCASNKHRGFQKQTMKKKNSNEEISFSSERKLLSKINSNIGSKAQQMVKLISWRKVPAEEDEEEEDYDQNDEAVWRKGIMMGERCRPLDFSGNILYDCEGNLLPADHSTEGDKSNKVIPLEKC